MCFKYLRWLGIKGYWSPSLHASFVFSLMVNRYDRILYHVKTCLTRRDRRLEETEETHLCTTRNNASVPWPTAFMKITCLSSPEVSR